MYDDTDTLVATTLRMLAADAVQQANAGHPGLPLGMADVATSCGPASSSTTRRPAWPDRDRFVLSAGHGSMLLYGLLHLAAILSPSTTSSSSGSGPAPPRPP